MDFKLNRDDQIIELKADRDGNKLTLTRDGSSRVYDIVESHDGEYLLRDGERLFRVTGIKNGERIYVLTDSQSYVFTLPSRKDGDSSGADAGDHGSKSHITAPMPGKVVKVLVSVGDIVEPKQKLVIVEAMKMENPLVAPFKAEVKAVNCSAGELVDTEKVLIDLVPLS